MMNNIFKDTLKKIYTKSRDTSRKHYSILLIIIGVISHWQWFTPGFKTQWQDVQFMPSSAYAQVGPLFTGTYNNQSLGAVNLQPYHDLFFQFWQFLSNLGINFPTAEQLTFFVPIALLSFIAPFFLIKEITSSEHSGFIGSLIYGFSCFMVTWQQGEPFIALGFCLLPLTIYFCIRWLHNKSWKSLTHLLLIINLNICVEIRTAFLALVACAIFLILHLSQKKVKLPAMSQILFGVVSILTTNLYWLIVIKTSSQSSISSTGNRDVFGNFLTNFDHALTTVNGTWFSNNQIFTMSRIPLIFWALPLLLIFSIYVKPQSGLMSDIRLKTFGISLIVLGVMEAKQVNPPFPQFFVFIRDNIPGFFLFRTGQFFNLYSDLGYAVMIGLLVNSKFNNLKIVKLILLKIVIYTLIIGIILANAVPMIKGEVGGLFRNQSAPAGLNKLDNFINNGADYYASLWVPGGSDWASYSLNHPEIAASEALAAFSPAYLADLSTMSPEQALLNHFDDSNFVNLVSKYSIKYVIVPPNIDNGYQSAFGGTNPDLYIHFLKSLHWLKYLGNYGKNYFVFLNRDFQSAQNTMQMNSLKSFEFINSSVAVGLFKNMNGKTNKIDLPFLYSKSWRAYVVPDSFVNQQCHDNKLNQNCLADIRPNFIQLYNFKEIRTSFGEQGEMQLNTSQLKSVSVHSNFSVLFIFGDYILIKLLFNFSILIYVLVFLILFMTRYFKLNNRRISRIK